MPKNAINIRSMKRIGLSALLLGVVPLAILGSIIQSRVALYKAQIARQDRALDPALHPISDEDLRTAIEHSDLSSSSNALLIERASRSDLSQTAYDAYNDRYAANPKGFYEILWQARATYELAASYGGTHDREAQNLFYHSTELLTSALKLRPKSALANAYLGHVLFRFESLRDNAQKQGVALMRFAIKCDPRCAEAHAYLADAYSQDFSVWFNPVKGQAEYGIAMKLDPTSSNIRLGFLRFAIHNSDKSAAMDALKGADQLVQGYPGLLDRVALCKTGAASLPEHSLPPVYPTADPVVPTFDEIGAANQPVIPPKSNIPRK